MLLVRNITVGTAGHVDHGKSTLVEALTGTNPDRLAEEKRRGITIDLGFAFLDLGQLRLAFVDVPGHERFLRNMLAGVGGIDLALLVVAADESIKPQTIEHFSICKLLGIRYGVVAVTKADLVDSDRLSVVRLEVARLLKGTFLEQAPIIPVSARTGAGLTELRQCLLDIGQNVPVRDSTCHFRLPIDRAFVIKGFGTVVTGTLLSGSVCVDEDVELLPGHSKGRVRKLESGGQSLDHVVAGQRTALNLAGFSVSEVRRGMCLVSPGRFESTNVIDARIEILGLTQRLKNHSRVRFHQGTSETNAEIIVLDRRDLCGGQTALARLRLEQPVLTLLGDRFILRQLSPVTTVGGGVVLNPHPLNPGRPEQNVVSLLTIIERGTRKEILAALADAHPWGLDLADVVRLTGWLETELRDSFADLETEGLVRILNQQPFVVVSAAAFASCINSLGREIEKFHRSRPLDEGIRREELRARAVPFARSELFREAMKEMLAAGAVNIVGDLLKSTNYKPPLRPEEEHGKGEIENAFACAGLTVPSTEEVVAKLELQKATAQKLLQLLLRERILIKVSSELVFHCGAISRLRELLANYKKLKGQRLTIADFKELTGVSRKYAIPLLEFLDSECITQRAGDQRILL